MSTGTDSTNFDVEKQDSKERIDDMNNDGSAAKKKKDSVEFSNDGFCFKKQTKWIIIVLLLLLVCAAIVTTFLVVELPKRDDKDGFPSSQLGNGDLSTAPTGTPPPTTTTTFVPSSVSPPDVAPTAPPSPDTTTAAPAQKESVEPSSSPSSSPSSAVPSRRRDRAIQSFASDISNTSTNPRSTILNSIHLSGDGNVLAMAFDRQIRVYQNNDSTNTDHTTNTNNTTIHHHHWTSVMPDTAIGEYCNRVALNMDGNIMAASLSSETVQVYQYDHDYGNYVPMGLPIVYEFPNNETLWSSTPQLFGSSSLSLSGSGKRIAIGGESVDYPRINIGLVRIYEWEEEEAEATNRDENIDSSSTTTTTDDQTAGRGTWKQLGQDWYGRTGDVLLGTSVAISRDGTTVITGAPWANGNEGRFQGYAQIIRFNETSQLWQPLGYHTGSGFGAGAGIIEGESRDDLSGTAVAISDDGSIVAVSATGANGNEGEGCYETGHVRIFQYQKENDDDGAVGIWVQLGDDIDGAGCYDFAGDAIALSGNGHIVALGAPDFGFPSKGHVRTFHYIPEENTWILIGQELRHTYLHDDGDWDEFGKTVSISQDGRTLAIGGNPISSGRIYQANEDLVR